MPAPSAIEHRDGLVVPQVIRRLVYDYDARDLPVTITEYDQVGPVAMVSFDYDNRGRLIHEARYTETPYELHYQYDQGGNRTEKLDTVNEVKVEYHYDIADPPLYESNNNRLELYETFDTFGTPDPLDDVLLSTTWYYYNNSGNATWIVTSQAGTNDYSATRMIYAKNGQTVSLMVNETWTWDGVADCPANYTITHGREYRYDNGRRRYLDRVLDVGDLMEGYVNAVEDGDTWTDYDGAEPYGDYTVDSGEPFNARSFELGLATVDPWADEDGITTSYYRTDAIGATRAMTDSSGIPPSQQQKDQELYPGWPCTPSLWSTMEKRPNCVMDSEPPTTVYPMGKVNGAIRRIGASWMHASSAQAGLGIASNWRATANGEPP